MTKVCTKCKEEKDDSEYSKISRGLRGRRSVCRVCRAKTKKVWADKNRLKVREYGERWLQKQTEESNRRRNDHSIFCAMIRYNREKYGDLGDFMVLLSESSNVQRHLSRHPEKLEELRRRIENEKE